MAISTGEKLAFTTVMNVKIFNLATVAEPAALLATLEAAIPLATIESLTTSGLNASGPTISIQGGRDNNVLLKHGKTMRLEMEDALANISALVALGGVEQLTDETIIVTEKFGKPVTILGDTIIVDQTTGEEQVAKVIIYKFLPDSIPSFNFNAESASVFALAGDVYSVELTNGSAFYSII